MDFPDDEFYTRKLRALVEAQVIYGYKSNEILLKKIIHLIYEDNNKAFFNWATLQKFLYNKIKTKIKKIANYKEFNELRLVTNFIKHSTSYKIKNEKDIKEIQEFKGLRYFDYSNLNKFYKRVQKPSLKFIEEIMLKMLDDYYDFPKEKLMKLSDEIKKEWIQKR